MPDFGEVSSPLHCKRYGTKPGTRPYLNENEEERLANHLITAAKLGYGKTRKQVKTFAEKVAREKGVLRKERITDGWWGKFSYAAAETVVSQMC